MRDLLQLEEAQCLAKTLGKTQKLPQISAGKPPRVRPIHTDPTNRSGQPEELHEMASAAF